jgi:uncharacterized protein (TIGR00730 family)
MPERKRGRAAPERPNRRLLKAYKNPVFLASEEARSVRILCEYLEPATRFHRLKIYNAIIFFGSARLRSLHKQSTKRDYYRLAADLAEKLARWTVDVHPYDRRRCRCGSGGPGIMQAGHEGAARVDRRLNVGLNISLPFEQQGNRFTHREQALEFHYFFMRKFWFLNLACGAVIFPGGFGTLDELFELLTLTQTGKSGRIPIVLFGREFWDRTVNFKALAEAGVISRSDLRLFRIVDTVDEAFDYLSRRLKPRPPSF